MKRRENQYWAKKEGYTIPNFMPPMIADWDGDDNPYHTELLFAVSKNDVKRINELLGNSRVDPSDNDNEAIKLAIERGNLDAVKRLLYDLRVKSSVDIRSLIIIAKENNKGEVAKYLSKHIE